MFDVPESARTGDSVRACPAPVITSRVIDALPTARKGGDQTTKGTQMSIHDDAVARYFTAWNAADEDVEKAVAVAFTEAVRSRVREMRRTGRHPKPSGQWPAIPWPPV